MSELSYGANVAMMIAGVWLALEYNNVQAYMFGSLLLIVGLVKNRG